MRRGVTTSTSLIAVLALLLAGLLGSTADARGARGKPQRDLHDAIVTKHGKLFFQGRVDPGHGPVIVQKKKCAKPRCHWHRFATVRTHGEQHRWSVRVFAPRHGNWYWRAYVKPYGEYARSWSGTWKTYVTPG